MKKILPFLLLFWPLLNLFGNGGQDTVKPVVPPVTPSLIYVEGIVMINGQQGEEGQELSFGSTIETGINSYCEVLFAEKNIIRIQEETITNIMIGQNQGRVELEKGSMAFLLEKLEVLGLGNRDFQVTTPLTTAGIRGTAFFIKIESPDSVYFCDCNGVINLSDNLGGNEQVLKSTQHSAVRYVKSDNRIVQTKAGLLYHDDEDMNALAAKISHKIPWGGTPYGSSD